MMENPFEVHGTPELTDPTLIVGWQTRDVGKIGSEVIGFLNEKLGGQEVGEITPLGFFPFAGIDFRGDVIQVPEDRFWACEGDNLLLFGGDEPRFEWYRFMNAMLDLAEYHSKAKQVYTVSGTVSLIAHTSPRRLLAVFNQEGLEEEVLGHGAERMDYEGQPAMNSYLLWVAKRRGLPAISLWPQVPFYLAAARDPAAIRCTLSFLDRRFNLGMDLGELDSEVEEQGEMIRLLRRENEEVDRYIGMLEEGLSLGTEEQRQLAEEVYELLERGG